MSNFLEQVHKKLIVSCQALEQEPLHSSYIMSRMAYAAMLGGAAGIRANTFYKTQPYLSRAFILAYRLCKINIENENIFYFISKTDIKINFSFILVFFLCVIYNKGSGSDLVGFHTFPVCDISSFQFGGANK